MIYNAFLSRFQELPATLGRHNSSQSPLTSVSLLLVILLTPVAPGTFWLYPWAPSCHLCELVGLEANGASFSVPWRASAKHLDLICTQPYSCIWSIACLPRACPFPWGKTSAKEREGLPAVSAPLVKKSLRVSCSHPTPSSYIVKESRNSSHESISANLLKGLPLPRK